MSVINLRIGFDRDRLLDPSFDINLDSLLSDEGLVMELRAIYSLFKYSVIGLRNSAIVEIDGLLQAIRIDDKDSRNFGAILEGEGEGSEAP